MQQNLKDKKANKQILRIGILFLMVGLIALIIFGEPTPLLFLGIVFTLSPFITLSSPSVINAS